MANINDKLRETFNSGNPEVTFVSSPRAPGATTLSADNLTGWSTNTAVDFVTYRLLSDGLTPDPGTQIDWKAIVSGSTLTNLTRVAGATDTGNVVNDIIEAMPTGSWANDLVKAVSTSLDQDGTLKAGAVDNAAALASTVVTEPKLADNSVDSRAYVDNSIDAEHLATNTIKLGRTIVTGSVTVTTSETTLATVTVTVPAGGRDIRIMAQHYTHSGSGAGDDATAYRIKEGSTILNARRARTFANIDNSGQTFFANVPAPTAGSHTYTYTAINDTRSSVVVATSTSPINLDVDLC